MKKLLFTLLWGTLITILFRFIYVHAAEDPDLNLLIVTVFWIIIMTIVYGLTSLWKSFQSQHKKEKK